MKVFIKNHPNFAGHWIYNKGFFSAWQSLGFDAILYDNAKQLQSYNQTDYYLMTTDGSVNNQEDIDILEKSKAAFLYVQPNKYELPWSNHPNFICNTKDELIITINNLKNVFKWSFADVKEEYYYKWNKVYTSPLAFDSINYSNFVSDDRYNFDICFIGGRANNGFDEKIKIMYNIFQEFYNSGLKCGFFVDANLPHDDEKNIIFNSKIALNIHDAYQRTLGLDTNERTFKSLGINGLLISDKITQLENLFNFVPTSNNPESLVKIAKNILFSYDDKTLSNIKEKNKKYIFENHSYINRIKNFLKISENIK
jgi:hypothetical protein